MVGLDVSPSGASAASRRKTLFSVDAELHQCRLSKYYPLLWTIITLLIYEWAQRPAESTVSDGEVALTPCGA